MHSKIDKKDLIEEETQKSQLRLNKKLSKLENININVFKEIISFVADDLRTLLNIRLASITLHYVVAVIAKTHVVHEKIEWMFVQNVFFGKDNWAWRLQSQQMVLRDTFVIEKDRKNALEVFLKKNHHSASSLLLAQLIKMIFDVDIANKDGVAASSYIQLFGIKLSMLYRLKPVHTFAFICNLMYYEHRNNDGKILRKAIISSFLEKVKSVENYLQGLIFFYHVQLSSQERENFKSHLEKKAINSGRISIKTNTVDDMLCVPLSNEDAKLKILSCDKHRCLKEEFVKEMKDDNGNVRKTAAKDICSVIDRLSYNYVKEKLTPNIIKLSSYANCSTLVVLAKCLNFLNLNVEETLELFDANDALKKDRKKIFLNASHAFFQSKMSVWSRALQFMSKKCILM